MGKPIALIRQCLSFVRATPDQRSAPTTLGYPIFESLPRKLELVNHLAFHQRHSARLGLRLEKRFVVRHVQFAVQLEIPGSIHAFAQNRKLQ